LFIDLDHVADDLLQGDHGLHEDLSGHVGGGGEQQREKVAKAMADHGIGVDAQAVQDRIDGTVSGIDRL
jgi:hypothetical protein